MSDALSEVRSERAVAPPSSQLQSTLGGSAGAKTRGFAPASRRLTAIDRKSILIGCLRAGDFVAAIVGASVSRASDGGAAALSGEWATFALLGAVLLVNYLQMTGSYEFEAVRTFPTQAARMLLGWSAVIVTLLAVSYSPMAGDVSHAWFVSWFCQTLAMLVAIRLASVGMLERWRRGGLLSCRLAIVGPDEAVRELARRVAAFEAVEVATTLILDRPGALDLGMRGRGTLPKGLFDASVPRAIPATCTADELIALSRSSQIDETIIVPGSHPAPALDTVIQALTTLAADVKVYAMGLDHPIWAGRPSVQFGLPLYTIVERPLSGWARVVKRAEDIVVSSVALFLLLPLLALVALVIKLESPGPVLFRQNRSGFNNDLIRIYKLRSMYHQPEPEHAVAQVRRNDPRVTRVGRVLRRTSLDELPQLLNVLRGDMSLVGPRPHPVALNEEFAEVINGYLARHRVKPGITGWAQVNGLRGETDTLDKMRRRVEHDLYYIDNWSLLFDLKILIATMAVGFMNKNAY
jgi:Undecaprenyl-phosphate glucose phosphotransferase